MTREDFDKIVAFIQGQYNRELNKNELLALKEELKDYDYEKFMNNLKFPLLKKQSFLMCEPYIT